MNSLPRKLSKNFWSSEFRCKDGTDIPLRLVKRYIELAEALEVLRAHFGGKRITITSGYRSPKHNRKVGGAKRSQHLRSACDFKIEGVSTRRVYEVCKSLIRQGKLPAGGVGLYRSWVHLDNRGVNKRWKSKQMRKR